MNQLPLQGGLLTRLRHGRLRVFAAPQWPQFAGADWLTRIMAVEVRDRLHEKQGRTIARWTLADGEHVHVVYLKRHYVLPRRHGWLAALFARSAWSPGWEEWQNLQWAASVGLPVPRVSAAGEFLAPWGRLQSFIAIEELAGMIGLHEAVPAAHRALTPEQFANWKRGLSSELARLCRELHRRRFFHKDLYFCHFYIRQTDCGTIPANWAGRVVMIDFHRLARHRFGWQWYLVKDLGQLLYSSEVPGVTTRDRLRFWKQYTAGDWSPVAPPGRWLRRFVLRKYRLYSANNRRRRVQNTAGSRPSPS